MRLFERLPSVSAALALLVLGPATSQAQPGPSPEPYAPLQPGEPPGPGGPLPQPRSPDVTPGEPEPDEPRQRAAGARATATEPLEEEQSGEPCERWCGRYLSFEERPRVILGVDLLPEIGTSAGYQDNHVRHLSLNLVGGYSGGLEGLELSSGFTVTTSHVYGVQLGGLLNLAGGNLYGVQAVGVLNAAASSPYGLQLAGAMNVAGGVPRGAQLAGGVNFANDGLHGAQVAAGGNLAGGLDGAQIGGVLNIVDSEHGAGAQIGAVNIASGGLAGAQIGAVNVSGPGRTNVQIGAINVAERTDLSLGLINVLWAGRTHLDLWFAETGFAHAGLKHGSDYVHNIYGLGVRGSGGPQLSFAFGIGGHLPVVGPLSADLDVIGHAIVPAHDAGGSLPLVGTLRAVANVRLDRAVALLVGPSYNVGWSAEDDGGQSYALVGDVVLGTDGQRATRGWPGFVLGLELLPPPTSDERAAGAHRSP